MKTVRRLLYRDILGSVAFVAVAFLALFFFIDFVDEMRNVGRRGYTLVHALLATLLEIPGHLYELAPIAVLIGTIYALSRMAQSSEFTILRTGGLGPGRALRLLTALGLVFAAITFLVGDLVAPASERLGIQFQAQFDGGFGLGRAGAWLKERHPTPEGDRSVSVNVGAALPGGELRQVRVFEFDPAGRLVRRLSATQARVDGDGHWTLRDVATTRWTETDARGEPAVVESRSDEYRWPTSLTSDVVAAAVLPLKTMSTRELYHYIGHLSRNNQAAQSYRIAFWKRALYPLSPLVMVALALPFAYLHARAGGVSLKVFGGIMIGISCVLLNNVAGHLGLLRDWSPWLAAAVPSLLYLALSLVAFTWLVRYR